MNFWVSTYFPTVRGKEAQNCIVCMHEVVVGRVEKRGWVELHVGLCLHCSSSSFRGNTLLSCLDHLFEHTLHAYVSIIYLISLA